MDTSIFTAKTIVRRTSRATSDYKYFHQKPPTIIICGRLFSSAHDNIDGSEWKPEIGQPIIVEVISFGPLGATVHVVAQNGHSPDNLPPEDSEWPVLATGLISQQELSYFRASRDNVDVVLGEVLPAYVERIRETDNKLGIALRPFGGKQKALDLSQQILNALESSPDGKWPLGDKSSPAEISATFPGVSKSTFKKALSALFKQGNIQKPGPHEIELF
jgi:hypothetical protein